MAAAEGGVAEDGLLLAAAALARLLRSEKERKVRSLASCVSRDWQRSGCQRFCPRTSGTGFGIGRGQSMGSSNNQIPSSDI